MTTAAPSTTPATAAAPQKVQVVQAPKPSAEQRIASIITPETDNSADGKKKPPVKQKSAPAKQAISEPAKPKAAPKGQADGDGGAADAANGDVENTDPFEADQQAAKGEPDGADQEEGDPEGETGETSEDGDDVQEGDDDDGTLYKVKVAGKELEVSLSELIHGYSRAVDYTRKTEAMAIERKAMEAVKESVKDLPQQRETYVKQAQFFEQAANATRAAMQRFMPAPPNPELAKTDPAAYFAQQKSHEDAKLFLGAIDNQLTLNQSRQAEELNAAHQKAVKESRVKLYEAMPDMQQPVARQKLREYANSLGFSDQSIQNETNHVLFVCVEKARRWDELQAKKASMKPAAPIQKVTQRSNAAETGRAVKQREKGNIFADHSKNKTIKSAERAIFAHLTAD